MTKYNKQDSGKSFGEKRGKPSFGGSRSGASSFSKKNWGGSRSSDGPATLHKATCSECNKVCEVPFRPVNGKPVYCKNCFNPAGGSSREVRGGDRFQKKEFSPRSSYIPRSENSTDQSAVMKQLETINTKIE
ncbi:MAG: hypothetical protein A2V96_00150, partial [Candidatus Yonathbacteria bacterium RBG_16_43_6]